MKSFGALSIGFALGLTYAVFTGVENHKLVNHHAAHYTYDGKLIWNDDNSSVH